MFRALVCCEPSLSRIPPGSKRHSAGDAVSLVVARPGVIAIGAGLPLCVLGTILADANLLANYYYPVLKRAGLPRLFHSGTRMQREVSSLD